MNDDFFGFLFIVFLIVGIGIWLIEYVLPVLMMGAVLVGPAGGAIWLVSKGMGQVMRNIELTWKSRLVMFLWGLIGLAVILLALDTLHGWSEVMLISYVIPAALAGVWLTFSRWRRHKTSEQHHVINELHARSAALRDHVGSLERRQIALQNTLARNQEQQAKGTVEHGEAQAECNRIIQAALDPRMMVVASRSLRQQLASLSGRELERELACTGRGDDGVQESLRRAVCKLELVDRRTRPILAECRQMEEELRQVEGKLLSLRPERDQTYEALQKRIQALNEQRVTLD